ncbi:MAG: RNA 3'-terminal phosphate cyclase, partial [Armatimonadota bacterium]|nr:RNA 3'-terminal phosphate cyclase [Armatimonadota bacterium]
GQTLRTSLTLAVLTGRAVTLTHIRAGREKPGLKAQHLAAVRAAAAVCAATTEGVEIGSTQLSFVPNAPVVSGAYHFDIGTAGAATLVAQTLLPLLALADGPSRVTVTGGTHVSFAPPAEHLTEVFLPLMAMHGLDAQITTQTFGFMPRGGGALLLTAPGNAQLRPFTLTERGPLQTVTAHILTSGLPAEVGTRGAAAVEAALRGLPLAVSVRDVPSPGAGAAVVLVAEYETGRAGFSALGRRGRPMEAVAGEACGALREWLNTGAACEEHLADQLVLPAALASGTSRWTTARVTEHLRTVLWVVPQFLDVRVTLTERKDGTGEVSVQGVGRTEKSRG